MSTSDPKKRLSHVEVEVLTNMTRSGISGARLNGRFPPPDKDANGRLIWTQEQIDGWNAGKRDWPPLTQRLRGPGFRRLPDCRNHREGQVFARQVGRIGYHSEIFEVGKDSQVVLVVQPEGKKTPLEQLRDLALFFPQAKFEFIGHDGQPADVNAASVPAASVPEVKPAKSKKAADPAPVVEDFLS